MRIEIIGRNYSPSEKLRSVIEKKSEKLNRYFVSDGKPESKLSSYFEKEDAFIKFVCTKDNNKERYTLEATLRFGDRILRVEEASDNPYESVDVIIPKLERQIRKLRTKVEKRIKSSSADANLETDEMPLTPLKAVRTKKFELKPLSVEAAIDELDYLDHDFFIYLNAETGKVNVVYKRTKGDVGVIECDY